MNSDSELMSAKGGVVKRDSELMSTKGGVGNSDGSGKMPLRKNMGAGQGVKRELRFDFASK